MRHAFPLSLLMLLLSITVSADQPSSSNTTQFQTIFDGQTLEGWNGDPRLWSVRDGVIHGETTPEVAAKGNTFLLWEGGKTGDFEVQLSFRCNATNNSGVQYRSKHITDKSAKNDWVVRGYQHEIRNEVDFPNISGFIYDEGGKRGRACMVGEKAIMEDGKKKVVAELITPAEFKELFRLDDWNDVTIKVKGSHIQHYMNGKLILDFTDSPELTHHGDVLALQLHAGKPMWTEFKDIRFRSL